MTLDAKIPEGKLEDKWRNYQVKSQLINPANKAPILKMNRVMLISLLAGNR